MINDRLAEQNSIAGEVESKLNEAGLITYVDTTVVSSATDSVVSAQPDASYKGTDSSGEVLIGLQTGSVIGTTGGGQEAAIPFTTTEAFEHEFSHIADGLSGLGNQSASGIISASGATVDVIRGGSQSWSH